MHPQISRPFNFRASLFYYNLPFFHSFVALFLLHLIFAHSHCVNLLPLIFAQGRCAAIKGGLILMGIRYYKLINFWKHEFKVAWGYVHKLHQASLASFYPSPLSQPTSTWDVSGLVDVLHSLYFKVKYYRADLIYKKWNNNCKLKKDLVWSYYTRFYHASHCI